MKNLILLFLLIPIFCFAQQEKLILTQDSDTLFFKSHKDKIAELFDLGYIEDNPDFYVFRSWKENSMLEINKDTLNNISGTITYFCEEDNSKREIFSKKFSLTSDEAIRAYNAIIESKIDTIPDQKFIKKWPQGFDGYINTFEIKEGKKYSYKNYWSAKSHSQIPQAAAVAKFVDNLYSNLKDNYYKKFESEIPFLFWHYPGTAYSVGTIVSEKELIEYNSLRRRKGLYVNCTKRIEKRNLGSETDTVKINSCYWAGYKFISLSAEDFKERTITDYFITKNRENIKKAELFNDKLPKLIYKINKQLNEQFNIMKSDGSNCLAGITFENFGIESMDISIDCDKNMTFRVSYSVNSACMAVMYDYVSLSYPKLKRYLKKDIVNTKY